mmetsp:Transcript_29248/g.40179  ORF Transcript_29248/g.40179 Transcript_29248/m.40179 type:complete len:327 (-) Transcript_29248:69-1049(-)
MSASAASAAFPSSESRGEYCSSSMASGPSAATQSRRPCSQLRASARSSCTQSIHSWGSVRSRSKPTTQAGSRGPCPASCCAARTSSEALARPRSASFFRPQGSQGSSRASSSTPRTAGHCPSTRSLWPGPPPSRLPRAHSASLRTAQPALAPLASLASAGTRECSASSRSSQSSGPDDRLPSSLTRGVPYGACGVQWPSSGPTPSSSEGSRFPVASVAACLALRKASSQHASAASRSSPASSPAVPGQSRHRKGSAGVAPRARLLRAQQLVRAREGSCPSRQRLSGPRQPLASSVLRISSLSPARLPMVQHTCSLIEARSTSLERI